MKNISAKLSFGFLCLAIAMNLLALAGCSGGGEGGVTPAPNPAPTPVTPTTPPEAPSSLQAQAFSQTAVRLNWSDNSANEDGFYVQRKAAGGTYAQVAILLPNITSYDDSGLTPGTTYSYRVMAYLGSLTSNFSNEATATTPGPTPQTADFIINHQHTGLARLNQIPSQWITAAKNTLHIAYGHTSHGSQLVTGMEGLASFIGSLYSFNDGGTGGALDLRDAPFLNAFDLGNPDRTAWVAATRGYLDSHTEVNVIVWSWCGQADGSESEINLYLALMSELEQDYPDVKFVYMTGHLDGTGLNGNVNIRNEQIRTYCRMNNKILYDFADIESYDPGGVTNFMVLNSNDGCYYSGGNWAIQWTGAHLSDPLTALATSCGECAHSEKLNCALKGIAAWWLWARLAGWNGQ